MKLAVWALAAVAVVAATSTENSTENRELFRSWGDSIENGEKRDFTRGKNPELPNAENRRHFPLDFLNFSTGNENCDSHLRKFADGIQNGSSWAIQMFDASSKLPTGLINANTYQFGNYDQCVNVLSPGNSVRGKYCLVNVEFSPRRNKYPPFYRIDSGNEFNLKYDIYGSVLEKFKVTKDFTKKRRNSFHSGLCIPESCGSEVAEIFLNAILRSTLNEFHYDIRVTIPDNYCRMSEERSFSREAKILGWFIIGFIIWVLLCTIFDNFKLLKNYSGKNRGKLQVYIEAFSLRHNISKFAAENSGGEMNIFNGMKSLSMILIIMGHRCMASFGGPFFNPQFLEERYRRMENILLLNGTLVVDTFFLIGGYLTFLGLFKECKVKGKLNFLQIYAYRWLRIAPVYILVVFFYAYLLEHVGGGPVWAMKVGREAERCRKNWWTNFFFINNYVDADSLCMFQSWYVTCDMHFTLLAPFIVKLMVKSPKKGLLLLILLILGSPLITFLIVYHNKYDGVLRVYITTFEDLATSLTFNKVYIKTHHRGTPYFSGMAAAYLYIKLKEAGHKFTRGYVWIYSVLSVLSSLTAICGAWIFYIPGRRYSALENALYAAVHRLMWSFGMSWIALCGATRAFGILEPFLSKRIFIPFSRLSYSTFLVHGIIQLYTTSTLRVPEYMSFPKLYWMTCGDVILSFAIAFLIHIFFEAPIKSIQMIIFSRKTSIKR